MPVNASIEEPTIPPRLRRPLAAVWISLGLHAALIALVQVAPPAAMSLGEPVIEGRLGCAHVAPAPRPPASAAAPVCHIHQFVRSPFFRPAGCRCPPARAARNRTELSSECRT